MGSALARRQTQIRQAHALALEHRRFHFGHVKLGFGRQSALLALIYGAFLAGLIVATFIDFEHFIIPDEITLGGAVVGVALGI